jgi:hypothetical protein
VNGIQNAVLLGNGNGTFGPVNRLPSLIAPRVVGIEDVNKDGHPDLLIENRITGAVEVLAGNGDGTFAFPQPLSMPPGPATVAADVNGDGIPDLISINREDNTVSVRLGNGDGTFGPPEIYQVGTDPSAVAVAYINGDGRPDIIVTDAGSNTLSVLLGNGDGTFRPQMLFTAGVDPTALVVAHLTGDGFYDAVVTNYRSGDVSVLLGNGDGTFRKPVTFAAGPYPGALAEGMLNGDGKPDLVVANVRAGTLSLLPGTGAGGFGAPQTLAVGQGPSSIAVADLTGDGHPDLVAVNYLSKSVSVLLGDGRGHFRPLPAFSLAYPFSHLAVADLRGDGIPDLVLDTPRYNMIDSLLGNGDGTFGSATMTQRDFGYATVAVDDANGDGLPDLLIQYNYSQVAVGVGEGNGTFALTNSAEGGHFRNPPQLADLNGDGILDSVVLAANGEILFRPGEADGSFGPAKVLNPKTPARDITLVNIGARIAVAAIDAMDDNENTTVSLYTLAADGSVQRTFDVFSTPFLPTVITAADLTDPSSVAGLGNLVLADPLNDNLQVVYQNRNAPGKFGSAQTFSVGSVPFSIRLTDVNGDGLRDIVVTDQGSGDVTVLLNDPMHSFSDSLRLRSDTGVYGLNIPFNQPAMVTSESQPVNLAVGDFTNLLPGSSPTQTDLVVVNRGSHSLSLLTGDGKGGFNDPQVVASTSDGPDINFLPGPLVAGHFHGPNSPLDLAVLMEDTDVVWIYTGDGRGDFTHTFSIPVGRDPTGLALAPGVKPGEIDLLVSNSFGDILRLTGQGDGTFLPPPAPMGDRSALDTQTNTLTHQPDVLVASQQGNSVTVQTRTDGSTSFSPTTALVTSTQPTALNPGAVKWYPLDSASDTFSDAVVMGSGSNNVVVYASTGFDANGNPTFAAPVTYGVGTNPVNVTIADINGDGIPDLLVPNEGSNDVSIIFGSIDAEGRWVGTPGPRLESGGVGPVAVSVVPDAKSPGGLDLEVTNGTSGTLAILHGLGEGFFDDSNLSMADNTLFNILPSTPTPVPLTIVGPPVSVPVLTPVTSGAPPEMLEAMATNLGTVIGYNATDPTGTATTLFAPPAGQQVDAVGVVTSGSQTGDLVVALAGGSVEVLGSSGSGTYIPLATLSLLNQAAGVPLSPSALEVMGSGSDLQVLVTNAGSDIIFVFGLEPPALTPSPIPLSSVPAPTGISEPTGETAVPGNPVSLPGPSSQSGPEPVIIPGAPQEASLPDNAANSRTPLESPLPALVSSGTAAQFEAPPGGVETTSSQASATHESGNATTPLTLVVALLAEGVAENESGPPASETNDRTVAGGNLGGSLASLLVSNNGNESDPEAKSDDTKQETAPNLGSDPDEELKRLKLNPEEESVPPEPPPVERTPQPATAPAEFLIAAFQDLSGTAGDEGERTEEEAPPMPAATEETEPVLQPTDTVEETSGSDAGNFLLVVVGPRAEASDGAPDREPFGSPEQDPAELVWDADRLCLAALAVASLLGNPLGEGFDPAVNDTSAQRRRAMADNPSAKHR